MPDRTAAFLVDIEDAIAAIRSYVAGMDQAAFLASAITCDACALQLTIIGEAARALPHDTRTEAPEIPWDEIVSLRNRIVHGYKTVDHRIVWQIIQDRIDELYVAVRRMLVARGE